MRVVREHDVARFLKRVGPLLGQRAAENNLMLGLLGEIARSGAVIGREAEYAGVQPVLLTVEGAGGIEAVALQTPPRAIILSRATEEATETLVGFAAAAPLALSGVIGPDETAECFASRWNARTDSTAVLRMAEMVYELERVLPPATCPGRLREAAEADEVLLAAWIEAFIREVGVDPIHDCAAFVRGKRSAGELFVWENGGPVSMAGWGGRTSHGVRIGYVYTPPAERKKGYASVLVAALSQRLLDEGSPRCFLFTNAANPTSNKIYQAIGYEKVCDFRLYAFHAAGP
jgi:predicted GNAT family acetyltransferase